MRARDILLILLNCLLIFNLSGIEIAPNWPSERFTLCALVHFETGVGPSAGIAVLK